MHDDCIRCEDLAKKYTEDELKALEIAYRAERAKVELYTRSTSYMRLKKGMGVTKKVATSLAKKDHTSWNSSGSDWELWWIGESFEAAHLVDGEALRDS